MSNKPKNPKSKDGLISVRNLMDVDTGEVFSCPTYAKKVQTDTNFYKIWLPDLLCTISPLGNAKFKVIKYVLENIQPANNVFIGTIESISKATDVGKSTIHQTLQMLVEYNFFKRMMGLKSVYMVNPDLIVKGDSTKHQRLMIDYQQTDVDFQQTDAINPNVCEE